MISYDKSGVWTKNNKRATDKKRVFYKKRSNLRAKLKEILMGGTTVKNTRAKEF